MGDTQVPKPSIFESIDPAMDLYLFLGALAALCAVFDPRVLDHSVGNNVLHLHLDVLFYKRLERDAFVLRERSHVLLAEIDEWAQPPREWRV